MIFFTSGGAVPVSFDRYDKLQLVSPVHYARAAKNGVHEAQLKLVPHFLDLDWNRFNDQKKESKKLLQLDPDIPVILSVGALDISVKRMHYVIEEVGKMSQPFFLVLLGEEETETPSILSLARQKLPPNTFLIKRVDRELLSAYYLAADVFVLATLEEGFGIAMAEAMAFGLPVVVNDYATAHYVLGDLACFIDMTKPGNLRCEITRILLDPEINSKATERRESIYKRLSWDTLRNDYLGLFPRSTEN
jgi:glycosyltransferase involved in cell wall biosynthesis